MNIPPLMVTDKDISLLKELYSIHSPTGKEWPLIQYILRFLKESVPDAKTWLDSFGNIYITKGACGNGGYPTLVSHLDQVQLLHSEDFRVKIENGTIFAVSESSQSREGLGADDKNGIFICLSCLERCPSLKVFFAVGEEKGCIGSNRADMDFFGDSLYILEPDCKGGEEIHTVLRGIPCASEEFIATLTENMPGYTVTEGKTSDILALTLSDAGVSCANIPAGYHNPHKDDEYTVLEELEKSRSAIYSFISKVKERFPHSYRSDTQKWVFLEGIHAPNPDL